MLLLVPVLVIWLAAEAVQRSLPPSLIFALTDEIAHASVATLCALPLVPVWGLRPLLVAMLAGTLIDVDHAIIARSFDPLQMMTLGARPPTHSLAGALLLTVLISALWGTRNGYAVLLGTITHIVRDADGIPGVPLFVPFIANAHVIVPAWILPAAIAAFGVTSITVAYVLRTPLRQRLRFS